jgi:hypothetical protein
MSSERLRTSGYTQTIPVPLHLEHDGLSLSHPSLLSRQRWQEDLLDVGRAVMASAGNQDQEQCGRQPASSKLHRYLGPPSPRHRDLTCTTRTS